MDTSISSSQRLSVKALSKYRWRYETKTRMAPLAVIKAFDVFLYCRLRVSSCSVNGTPTHSSSCHRGSPCAHCRSSSPARHGRLHAELFHQFLIVLSVILAATFGMMNQPWHGTFVAHRLPQRLCRQRLHHPFIHHIAHQFAGNATALC